jgi:two-component system LytT family response regulator
MARVNQHWQGLHATAGPALESAPAGGYAQRLSVRHGEHIRILAVDDIDWIRADGNYLHRDTLRHLLAQLDPARFLRIHRGTLVNLARVREVHPMFKGGAEVVLHDGTRLDLSRRFRAGARAVLGLH